MVARVYGRGHNVSMAKVLCLLFPLLSLAQDSVRGEKLYGSCRRCHGDRGLGDRQQRVPRIGGQHDWYLVDALKDFKNGERKDVSGVPHENLKEEEIKDLGAYISGLLAEVTQGEEKSD